MALIASSTGSTKGPSGPVKVGLPKPPKPVISGIKVAGSLVQNAANSITGSSPSSSSGGSGGAGSSPYLDPTALANIAAYLNKTNSQIADDNTSITSEQAGLQNTLGQYKQANQMANLRLMTGDNASGGFYGSAYGQQLGNQNSAYGQKEDAATSATNLNIAKLQSAIAELQASQGTYADQQAADAAARESASAAKLAPAASTPAPPARPASTQNLAQKVAAARGKAAANQLRQRGTPMGGFR